MLQLQQAVTSKAASMPTALESAQASHAQAPAVPLQRASNRFARPTHERIQRPAQMFTGSFRPDDRVSAAQLEMCTRRTITIAEHVENRNTASEVLCRRFSVAARHVQHSVQPMSFAREIQIGCVVSRLSRNALKLPVAVVEIIGLQISFGSNQP